MAGIVPEIFPSDISGGSAGDGGGVSGAGTGGEILPRLDDFVTDEGGVLAIASGEHLIAGHLIVHKYEGGPPPVSRFIVALGDGVPGRWDSIVKAWYAGEELAASPDGSTPGYHFHPGTISTGIADATQGVDSFLTAGLAYSGTPYVAVRLPDTKAVEDRPDKLRVRAKCQWYPDYDVNGNQVGFAYSVNPARVAAGFVRAYYETRYSYDLALAFQKFQRRINWPLWVDWRDYNAATIPWNDGASARNIPRFESHVAFTADATLADALDVICASAGAVWQDTGEQLVFYGPAERDPIHHFHYDPTDTRISNIKDGSFNIVPRDLRERFNYLTAKFRNLDDEFLTEVTAPEVKRPDAIRKVGKLADERRFANMTISQAQRLLERQMRLEFDNPNIVTLRGLGDSLHVLKGDFVTVTHPSAAWNYQKCLVLDVNNDPAEKSPNETDFTLQAINGQLYYDTDHGPVQAYIAP